MKGPQGFGELMNIIMNVVMCLAISIVVLYRIQSLPGMEVVPIFTASAVVQSWLMTFFVGYTIGELVPISGWAMKASAALHAKGAVAYIVQCVVLGFCFATVISLFAGFLNNFVSGGWEAVFQFYIMHLPVNILVAILVVCCVYGLAQKIAAAISGFDPSKMPPTQEA